MPGREAHGPELAERVTMIVIGAYFVLMGNGIPKTLAPLSALRDPAAVQSARRLAGWAWVLTGLAFIIVWPLAPIGLATLVSMAVLFGVAVLTALLRARECATVPRQSAN
jgi:hypothetical protein